LGPLSPGDVPRGDILFLHPCQGTSGAQLISEVGGCSAILLNEGVSPVPGLAFKNLQEVGQFLTWAIAQQGEFQRQAEATTRHGKLIDMRLTVEGNHVYLEFQFTRGDAAGKNIVTIATEANCKSIRDRSPVQLQYSFLEANLSYVIRLIRHCL